MARGLEHEGGWWDERRAFPCDRCLVLHGTAQVPAYVWCPAGSTISNSCPLLGQDYIWEGQLGAEGGVLERKLGAVNLNSIYCRSPVMSKHRMRLCPCCFLSWLQLCSSLIICLLFTEVDKVQSHIDARCWNWALRPGPPDSSSLYPCRKAALPSLS